MASFLEKSANPVKRSESAYGCDVAVVRETKIHDSHHIHLVLKMSHMIRADDLHVRVCTYQNRRMWHKQKQF